MKINVLGLGLECPQDDGTKSVLLEQSAIIHVLNFSFINKTSQMDRN